MKILVYHWIICFIMFAIIIAAEEMSLKWEKSKKKNGAFNVTFLIISAALLLTLSINFFGYYTEKDLYKEKQQEYSELMDANNSGKVTSYYDIKEWKANAKDYNECIEYRRKCMTYPLYKKVFFGVNDNYNWDKLSLIDEKLISANLK